MKWIVPVATGMLAVASSAQASEQSDFMLATSANLAALCASTSEPAAIQMCQGYLLGVHHMHQAVGDALGQKIYCMPDNGSVTRDSAAHDFAAWVAATPAAAAMPAREGLLEWARITYPCQ